MQFTVIIPARYSSSRLPGKPLADIGGKPMIQRVVEQARLSQAARVVVATDDARIADTVRAFGAEVCMTKASHVSGTDRLQEVAEQLGLADDALVVNVQGDEPLIPPEVINQVAGNLASNPAARMATLCEPIEHLADVKNPNVVKAVFDRNGMALYFSRAPMPWARDAFASAPDDMPAGVEFYRHIGLYAYRVGLLNDFVTWPQSALEKTESLEQLRVLEQGERIHIAPSLLPVPGGVDTPADLERVRARLAAS
ncbi:3-deoxy-manno-octulosonate cytidylyltransferase [Simiduia agarivorans]|uniref:3-deoxy-manno-octulosonate cytidylyltransferase n=1 Tax=Simiduia agarivorans (strain DSM 21679 / JCM 13881 / BCRC 17597 / SA1) TaxID=1117647 RepID=K4KU65_SIMAS|nr:3-deoxy-manno-octulosonate cytidylyltransferase [Simiduia agarivorans]AFU97517.1 3-deoxy-manno-octulosonate cytidylyltransferase [Simiduia agarivorans SA1 = DSM 21679]